MSKQITITFQASEALHGWLKAEAEMHEVPLGTHVRGLCIADKLRKTAEFRSAGFVPVKTQTGTRVLTVAEAKRLAGKAPR